MTPYRFTSMNRCHCSGRDSTKGPMPPNPSAPALPALFTRMSIRPEPDADSIPARTASRSVTSKAAGCATPPAERICSTTASARSATRSFTSTSTPAAAKRRAMAAPTPCPAPVTSARLPSSSNVMAPSQAFWRQPSADQRIFGFTRAPLENTSWPSFNASTVVARCRNTLPSSVACCGVRLRAAHSVRTVV